MKKIALFISFLLLPVELLATNYTCKEHEYSLERKSVGYEHVNHQVLLNGKVHIKEIEESMWFVETVTCNKKGFSIVASHIQYNDPTKKTFTLVIKNNAEYEIN